MKKILVFGASGHAKVVIDIIERQNEYTIFGLIDSFKLIESELYDYKVLGTEYEIASIVEENDIYGCIVAIGDNYTRKIIADKLEALCPKIVFINAIHPNAYIGKNVILGRGNVIMPGVIVNSDTSIGDFCIINTNASVGHDSDLKNFTSISPGVKVGGNLSLGFCSSISIGAIILENISIGIYTIIGAGSVVTKNIPSFVIAYGNPAKIIRDRKENEKYLFSKKERKNQRSIK
tara:strand:- start:12337 stop:13038 length:702 start_codon:yes stop_codon:yes gene_type:complete